MKIIAANMKMNLLKNDIDNYLKKIDKKITQKVIFFPSNIYIQQFANQGYLVGSQDISFKEMGAITGDTSILQLKELGISYTIIGHSERRKFYQDDLYISSKIDLALKNNIKFILCIGEKTKQDENQTLEYLKQEIDKLNLHDKENIENYMLLAYEPIWAIGSGEIPSISCLEKIIFNIKNYLKATYNLNIKVLYGGSVDLNNINDLEKITNLDGYLIGSSSLNPDTFLDLIKNIK